MSTPTPTAPTPAEPGSSGTAADADPALAALQLTLAAEHAAVFVYGALGAQTSQSRSPGLYAAVTAAYAVHRTRRDELVARVRDAGAAPVPAEPGYDLPDDLGSASAVQARARALEEAAARTYAYLVANSVDDARGWAVAALIDAAVRSLGFGAAPDRLPGL